ncbi:MAG: NAD-glutamate dehydrogenase [Sphingomonadales bacterium]
MPEDTTVSINKRKEIISKTTQFATVKMGIAGSKELNSFIEGFYGTSPTEELINSNPERLFAVACSMKNFMNKRKLGTAKVKVFNPTVKRDGWASAYTILQVVNDDMPFLVDSISGGISVTQRMDVFTMHHPQFFVERTKSGASAKVYNWAEATEEVRGKTIPESIMFIEIEKVKDPKKLKELEEICLGILLDVRLAVSDWRSILSKVDETISALAKYPPPITPDDVEETRGFIKWLVDDNFIFLGYREYMFEGDPLTANFKAVRGSGMGILQNPGRFILRGPKGLTSITREIREFLIQPDPIIITKGNVKTQVHRPVHLDYIGVKIFNPKGVCIGERRFVGLFTSASYSKNPLEIPLIRRKVENIQRKARFAPGSHASKSLSHILETFPRDELFQISEEDLFDFSILHLSERPEPKAFARVDRFERFVSVLVYVSRESYNSDLRRKIELILCDAFNGEVSVYYAQLSEKVLARWHFIIRTKPGKLRRPSMKEVNEKIGVVSKVWSEHLLDDLMLHNGDTEGKRLHQKYSKIFSAGYQEDFKPQRAAADILCMEPLNSPKDIVFNVYCLQTDEDYVLRLKIYHASEVVPLSQCLPMLENLGLKVIDEHAYEIANKFGGCIHNFYMENNGRKAIDVPNIKHLVEEILYKIWNKELEDDGLNALAICAGLGFKEVTVLRAYSRYLRQIGLSYSQDYVENCLVENPIVAKNIFLLFDVLFNPKGGKKNQRVRQAKAISNTIRGLLDYILSLDQDRILRNFLNVLLATLRTNFYKTEYIYGIKETGVQPGLALKLRSASIEELPKPKPHVEIFVYSPRFEGVHLRGGMVARGGIRWSDRPEDFRTEVLGLVKAQQVKNAVIVPVGAKGGFYAKHLGETNTRAEFMAEGISCYKSFVTSLLTVTDNLVKGKIIPPNRMVRWDKGDPYLVVAADKGTTTFSDIANALSIANKFWLGDAFASGGSVGYDHKKMGITAKGAWVSIERHFRELGVNVFKDPVSVIGIGDMSGDVFGNGMLSSKTIKLNVAFDHRHIFFDPNPDLKKSFEERKRLFILPLSSWKDYNKKLISIGGGVFSRSSKSIKLSSEFKTFLGIEVDELSPIDLINCILKSKADLLWFGGIGTYIKASSERHTEVGDRANDGLRINGKDLRVRVVGEGGNLGMTQKSRIEFASLGGRLNTDFIDNSAGVDCSDKEVNIKILLARAIENASLSREDRPKLLSSMTCEVSKIVLEDNYLQTQAISIAETLAISEREQHAGLIRVLEKEGRLDREIEHLPSEEKFSELSLYGKGLTRPELCVLISYAKMSLNDILLQSDVLKNEILKPELGWGFPNILLKKFAKELNTHQLKKEIIATTLANEVINRGGLTFVHDIWEETGLAVEQIVSGFLIVRDCFGLNKVWEDIDKLDYKVDSSVQIMMHNKVSEFTKHQATWFLRNMPIPLDILGHIATYKPGLEMLMAKFEKTLNPVALRSYKGKVQNYILMKVPLKISKRIAALEALGAACDIVNVAEEKKLAVGEVALAYFDVGHKVGFDWLKNTAEAIIPNDHWEQLAINAIVDDLADQQRELTSYILRKSCVNGPHTVSRWLKSQAVILLRSERLLVDLKGSGTPNIAKVSFAARHIRTFLPI